MTIEQIRELFTRLSTLTTDELAQLKAGIVSVAGELDTDEATVEQVAVLNELADFGDGLNAEETTRTEQAAEAQASREAARQRIAALNPEADTETETEPAAEGTEPADDPDAAAEPAEGAQVPEPVAASGRAQVARMAARQRPATASPEATPAVPANRAVLTASASISNTRTIREHGMDSPLEDRNVLGAAMAEKLSQLDRRGASRGNVLVASATWTYPEDRRLGDDAFENSRKIEAVTNPVALTASGGICLPVNVDYAVPTWAAADRPLRDGLPSFEASRGGIRFVQPPQFGALSGATGIWTEATDAAPGASTKPIMSIACGTEELVYVEAISTRLGFGNMQSRFAPEQVAANTDLAIAAASRVAENNLLNLIASQCQADVTSASVLGATRDFLVVLDQVAAAYRSVNRIPRTQKLTAILPDWIHDLIRADIAQELAHDSQGRDPLAVMDAEIDAMITARGYNPVFHLDGQAAGQSGGVNQLFPAQGAGAPVLAFPTSVTWYVFAEGMFQFLDGGRLDLGVVRDSTLDATNDYETFVETFEGIAYRGFAGGAYQMVSTLKPTGGSAATVSTAGAYA